MKAIVLLLFEVALFSFAACTKQGPAGAPGTPGPQGNANVQSIVFSGQSFLANTPLKFTVPAITQTILDSGSVNIYARTSGATDWVTLPYAFSTQTIDTYISVGQANVLADYSSTLDFKVVVIAGQ
jgi:hypothetical protein